MTTQIKRKIMKHISLNIILFFVAIIAISIQLSAQSNNELGKDIEKAVFYFRFNNASIDFQYLDNAAAIDKLNELLTSSQADSTLQQIIIETSSSPEGSESYNERLTLRRGYAVQNYIIDKYPHITPTVIELIAKKNNWEWLKEIVLVDSNLPYRQQIIELMNSNLSATDLQKSLKNLGDGEAWSYIEQRYLVYKREAVVCVILLTRVKEQETELAIKERKNNASIIPINEQEINETIVETPIPGLRNDTRRPSFVAKTNLLYDAATVLNIELEIPIGKRWSVAAEWVFPWWLWSKKQICLELLNGNLEGRYWLGSREKKPVLTGWFVGLYGGGGKYDLEWKTKGYQGEFFSMGGSGGFAHKINKKGTLRMEDALSVGYMKTKYREYKPKWGVDEEWHLIKQRSGKYTWVGPTRVKVSLVWMLTCKSLKKNHP